MGTCSDNRHGDSARERMGTLSSDIEPCLCIAIFARHQAAVEQPPTAYQDNQREQGQNQAFLPGRIPPATSILLVM